MTILTPSTLRGTINISFLTTGVFIRLCSRQASCSVCSPVKGLICRIIVFIKNISEEARVFKKQKKERDESVTAPVLKRRNRPKELPLDTSMVALITRSGRGGLVRVLDSGGTRWNCILTRVNYSHSQ